MYSEVQTVGQLLENSKLEILNRVLAEIETLRRREEDKITSEYNRGVLTEETLLKSQGVIFALDCIVYRIGDISGEVNG